VVHGAVIIWHSEVRQIYFALGDSGVTTHGVQVIGEWRRLGKGVFYQALFIVLSRERSMR